MSVLCCRIADFPLALAYRHHPHLRGLPLALVGPDDAVAAASPAARRCGVSAAMCPRQAQMRCPDIRLHPLDLAGCQDEQQAWLGTLAEWGLPVEAQGWGFAYIDMHTVAAHAPAVQPLAVDLGRRLRQQLGDDLQPALGWDSGKFTSRAAAVLTQPGRLRLVGAAEEVRFLAPLPISLLPLPPPALQQLHWLGIRTLGHYAKLPRAAVWQRFGQAGKLAQQWAAGHDTRPVRNTVQASGELLDVDLEAPTDLLPVVVEALMAALRPPLESMAAHLEGCSRLRLTLHFVEDSARTLDLAFVEPVSQPERLQIALTQRLLALSWPAELSRILIGPIERAELAAHQPVLFPDLETPGSRGRNPLMEIAHQLANRYGPLFFRGEVVNANHPLPSRRSLLQPLL
jgi:protein ImuB